MQKDKLASTLPYVNPVETQPLGGGGTKHLGILLYNCRDLAATSIPVPHDDIRRAPTKLCNMTVPAVFATLSRLSRHQDGR